MSRDAILARIRAANADAPAQRAPSFPTPPSLVTHADAAVSRFRTMATAKAVTVIDVANPQALPAAISAARTRAENPSAPIRLADPRLATLDWTAAGLSVTHGPASPADAVTLSYALAAVAETGTLILASGPDNPTTLAFLPETHLVVVDRTTILGTFEEAVALLRQTYGTSLPRTLNFISGASRTGDIGGRIVHGAHGPRRLFVFICP